MHRLRARCSDAAGPGLPSGEWHVPSHGNRTSVPHTHTHTHTHEVP